MIVAELKGGLGNQCFQLAAAIGHAVAHGREWGFYGAPDPTLLALFPDLASRRCVAPGRWRVREGAFPYQPLPSPTMGTYMLSGYFQSWRYFAAPAQEAAVRAAFRLPGWVVKPIGSAPVIGVHVRRGDYLQKPACHRVVPMDYYHRAREALAIPGGGYHIVSDDPGWVREWFDWTGATFGDDDPVHDFLGLACCQRVIAANSTFSWWAAWLGRAQRVTLPRPWFGPALPHDTRDLLPPGWQWVDWTPAPAKEPA